MRPLTLFFTALAPLLLVSGCHTATPETDEATPNTQAHVQVTPEPASRFTEYIEDSPDCRDLMGGPWRVDLHTAYERSMGRVQTTTTTATYTYLEDLPTSLTCTMDVGIPHGPGTVWRSNLPEGVGLFISSESQAQLFIDTTLEPGTTLTLTAINGSS